jgi:hypothetical protein
MNPLSKPSAREDADFPESKIEALLAAGDLEGARMEFERLCLEGLQGEPIAMAPSDWEEFRQNLHRKAKLAS